MKYNYGMNSFQPEDWGEALIVVGLVIIGLIILCLL